MARTQEEYLQVVRAVHKNFYSYPNLNYTRAHDKIRIECPVHGEFCQSANSHLRGTGCPKCGSVKKGKTRRLNLLSKRPDLSHIEVPEGSKAVPVGTKGDYALVDTEDYERVMEYNWSLSRGYARNNVVGMMHRFIMNPPDDLYIDHVFHNKLDNRKGQLRVCTTQQNGFNSKARGGTSTYKGVYWDKRRDKWVARIIHNQKGRFLGFFTTEEEAALAYDRAAKEIQGEFAHLNIVL